VFNRRNEILVDYPLRTTDANRGRFTAIALAASVARITNQKNGFPQNHRLGAIGVVDGFAC
jgi:hypothetical protein